MKTTKLQRHVMRAVRRSPGWGDYKKMVKLGHEDLTRIEVVLYESPASHEATLESGDMGDILDWDDAKGMLRPGMSLDVLLSVSADELSILGIDPDDHGIEDVAETVTVELPREV